MGHQHREYLRKVMLLAWQKLGWERNALGRTYSLSEALRHAWAWIKGEAARKAGEAAASAAWAASGHRTTQLRSPVRSPVSRALRGQRYAGATDRRAAYLTGRLGY
jgi:hypothetical protein